MDIIDIDDDFLDFLNRCAQKEKKSWDIFVNRYGHLIYHYIKNTLRRYISNLQNGDTEDIFNTVFLNLLDEGCKGLRNFRGKNENSFLAYLRVISFHITVDYLRGRKHLEDFDKVRYYIANRDLSRHLDNKNLREIVSTIRKELPERQNYLFRLIYEEGLNSSEIAEIMNINLNALNQLKFRMIKNIIKIAKRKNLYQELKIQLTESSLCSSKIKCNNKIFKKV